MRYKYPYFSNWADVEFIPENNRFYVKNNVLKNPKKCFLTVEEMAFAKSLTGKVNPYDVRGGRGWAETKRLIEKLESEGVLRNDRKKTTNQGLPLHRVYNDQYRKVYSIVNSVLLMGFIPVFLLGLYTYFSVKAPTSDNMFFIEMVMRKYPMLSSIIISVVSTVLAVAIHEMAHANACRSYHGRVYDYSFKSEFLPVVYVFMDVTNISSAYQLIQVYAAGIEANIFISGVLLCLQAIIPHFGDVFEVAIMINVMLACLNITAIKGTDGQNILLIISDIDKLPGHKRFKKVWRKKWDKSITDYVMLTAYYILFLLQKTYIVIVILEIAALTFTVMRFFINNGVSL